MLTRIATSLVLILGGSVSAISPPLQAQKSCRQHPQLIGKCFNVRGRLSVYNGAPAVRLWRILMKQLNEENEIFGDFLVCPFTPVKPREMQLVCIESAKDVVVKKRK